MTTASRCLKTAVVRVASWSFGGALPTSRLFGCCAVTAAISKTPPWASPPAAATSSAYLRTSAMVPRRAVGVSRAHAARRFGHGGPCCAATERRTRAWCGSFWRSASATSRCAPRNKICLFEAKKDTETPLSHRWTLVEQMIISSRTLVSTEGPGRIETPLSAQEFSVVGKMVDGLAREKHFGAHMVCCRGASPGLSTLQSVSSRGCPPFGRIGRGLRLLQDADAAWRHDKSSLGARFVYIAVGRASSRRMSRGVTSSRSAAPRGRGHPE